MRRRLAMAGVAIAFCGALHSFRLVAQQFARATTIEPGVGGLEPNRNTPRTDRPEEFQNGFQGGYGAKFLIKAIARESILALIRKGKNLALLFSALCTGGEVALTELAALADFFGCKPLGILQGLF
jgi:hypothetical protein